MNESSNQTLSSPGFKVRPGKVKRDLGTEVKRQRQGLMSGQDIRLSSRLWKLDLPMGTGLLGSSDLSDSRYGAHRKQSPHSYLPRLPTP